MRANPLLAALLLAALPVGTGCGGAGADGAGAGGTGRGSKGAAPAESAAVGDDPVGTAAAAAESARTSASGSRSAPAGATDGSGGASAPEGEILLDSLSARREYPLLMVNLGDAEALVYASAGAGRVLLDTVPGGDSVRVNVAVRGSRLRLEATDRRGEPLGAEEVPLDPGGLLRWEVPAPPAAEGGAGRGG